MGRAFAFVLAMGAVATACGGQSVGEQGGTGAVGTGGGSGGSRPGVGGTSGSGTGGTSGSGTGGTSGSGTGGSPTLGTCSAPVEVMPGPCHGAVVHDPDSGECRHTGDGSCASGENQFGSFVDCLSTCNGARPSLRGCDQAIQCAVASVGCCGLCGDEDIGRTIGVNRARLEDYRPCGDVLCEQCPEVPEASRTTQYFVPACVDSECTVTDLRTTDATACTVDEQCFLRLGTACCEACGGNGFAALSSTAFLAQECGFDYGCPDCVTPEPPEGMTTRCVDGRCRVVPPPMSGGG